VSKSKRRFVNKEYRGKPSWSISEDKVSIERKKKFSLEGTNVKMKRCAPRKLVIDLRIIQTFSIGETYSSKDAAFSRCIRNFHIFPIFSVNLLKLKTSREVFLHQAKPRKSTSGDNNQDK
jgi:hypothetical protein